MLFPFFHFIHGEQRHALLKLSLKNCIAYGCSVIMVGSFCAKPDGLFCAFPLLLGKMQCGYGWKFLYKAWWSLLLFSIAFGIEWKDFELSQSTCLH